MVASKTANCVASAAWIAFVAASTGNIVEIDATCSLHDISANRRHVSDLRGGA